MLIISTSVLSILGLIMVFSASSIHSLETKGSTIAIVLRQLIFLVVSIPMAIALAKISLERWQLLARFGLLISLILMLVIQIDGVGKSVNGNKNWISLKIIDIQPSELAKFLMILWASYLLSKREESGHVRTNVLFLITPGFLLIMAPIMMGNDLGNASVLVAILAGLLFVSGIQMRLMVGFFIAAAGALTYFIATAPYRVHRFLVVLNPFAAHDYKNAGWQPAHSILGLASGGLFGVGLGASRQKWGNLAEAHTDFIFSIIGEELGLFGTLAVLILLAVLIYSIFRIGLRAQESMVRYACAGIATWLGAQVILNIGSSISVIPVVGVTLPLLSYGGSALISTFLGLGFVAGAALRDPDIRRELKKKI